MSRAFFDSRELGGKLKEEGDRTRSGSTGYFVSLKIVLACDFTSSDKEPDL
jgi:hypothetical protein